MARNINIPRGDGNVTQARGSGGMTIGAAARASGITAKMIRFYEAEGLLPQADRSGSGFRLYFKEDLRRLQFIALARSADIGLAEIRQMVEQKQPLADLLLRSLDQRAQRIKDVRNALLEGAM